MLSIKDNFLETMKKDGKPDRLVNMWEPFELIPDPVLIYLTGHRARGTDSRDRWGTLITWPEDQLSAMPHVTEDEKVLPDITEWRKYIKVPDLAANCSEGWDVANKMQDEVRAKGKLSMTIAPTGVFEQLHFLMGFEDMLMNFLLEPDDMLELCETIGNYRAEYMKLIVENLKPDVVLSHDDWGSKQNLFVSPEIWREFIKPQYVKIYKILKDAGVLIMHHSDSICEPIIEDMIDIGIDIWQGAIPENDLLRLQKEIGGRMVMMGGLDMSIIDLPDAKAEQVTAETLRACETYTPGGNFIVSFTYGGPGDVIFKHIEPFMTETIDKFNKDKFGV
ncbi:MAG: uroporphyrinogen decarboxylase (URO-D) [Oscillospiraceae bacterium]|nr:uroporphyrinogen decarboxylase (URO-D) [Oscillospiraceae bacterium]MCL2201251.1 uroporphyrinogen decarboxylase (URO-D) [Oscillospiraceae bacterium]